VGTLAKAYKQALIDSNSFNDWDETFLFHIEMTFKFRLHSLRSPALNLRGG
jgi:hypothetical protein